MPQIEWQEAEDRLRQVVDDCKTEIGPATWFALERILALQERFECGERTQELLEEIRELD